MPDHSEHDDHEAHARREHSERERNPYGPRRRYDRAPAPVKVAVSLVYIQMGMLFLASAAVNLTLARTPGGETSRWTMSGLVFAVAVFYGLLAYRLLQGVEWARRVAIGLTGVSMALALFYFSVWLCIAIALGATLIAALLSRDARRFFASGGAPPEGGALPPEGAAPPLD